LSVSKIAERSNKITTFKQVAKNIRRATASILGEKYLIEYKYNIGGIGDSVGPYFTMLTLGIVPFYSTNNADVDVLVKKNNSVVFKEKLDSRFHTTYGWLAIGSAEKNNSEDLMNWHEGDSMQNHMIKTLDERVVRYLELKLQYENN